MAPRTTPQAARARLHEALDQVLDRLVPANEQTPLRLKTFADFEDAAEEHAVPLVGMVLEELASLSDQADVSTGGRCPHCCGENVRLVAEAKQREVQSRYGPVVYSEQAARCRDCGRTFFPSAS